MSKPSLGTWTTVVVGLALALSMTPAFADSQVRIVRLSDVEGTVQVDKNAGQGFEKAFMNMPVVQGMKLATKEDGRAAVQFEDGSTIRITPKSSVEFDELALRDSGGRVSTFTLKSGMAYVNFTGKGKSDEFTIQFENQKIRADHPVHFRIDVASDSAELAVFNGDLKVEGPSGDVEVGKNKTAVFNLTDNDKHTIAKNVEQAPFDVWDKQQIKYEQEYANRGSSSYPYGYGVSDLNYYGSYYDVPGYGMMWQPYFAGLGWSPFTDGAWMFYPGFGYTWVSAYPWGWMPYRYGSWAFVPGYGWMWAPGGFGTWYTIPPVVNPPNRFPTPKPPMRGTATVVVGHPVMSTAIPSRLLVQSGSAGLGIPRGTVSSLGKVSREVQTNGFATVRAAPPARASGGNWGSMSSGTGASHMSVGGGHMSSGGHTSTASHR